jgi:hypothetical protein
MIQVWIGVFLAVVMIGLFYICDEAMCGRLERPSFKASR